MKTYLAVKDLGTVPGRKDASSAVRTLLSQLLCRISLPASLDLKTDKNGRPYIPTESGIPEIDFNFSHAGRYVVCALAVAESGDLTPPRIGVDVEIFARKISAKRIAERFFAEAEIEMLRRENFSDAAFLAIWTKKEAYLKFTGTGLAHHMKSADTSTPLHLTPPAVFQTYPLPDAILTVAVAKNVSPPKAIEFF